MSSSGITISSTQASMSIGDVDGEPITLQSAGQDAFIRFGWISTEFGQHLNCT